jgi:prepilin-type N-terminal cleavage/methylation domain-containing protein
MCKRRGFTSLAGFTLIELLVAITIFSVLIVAISGTLASGLRAWKLVESLDATQRKSLLTLEKVSRELRQTVIYNRIGFTGTAHSFSFCRAKITTAFSRPNTRLSTMRFT